MTVSYRVAARVSFLLRHGADDIASEVGVNQGTSA